MYFVVGKNVYEKLENFLEFLFNYVWIGLNFLGWLSKQKSKAKGAVSIICQIVWPEYPREPNKCTMSFTLFKKI